MFEARGGRIASSNQEGKARKERLEPGLGSTGQSFKK